MKSNLQNCQPEREYLFDNMKAILMVLVVMGHLFVNVYRQHPMFQVLYVFIYIFHMPVFVFVTGYFSKNAEKCRSYAIEKYLVPYLVFCVLLQVEDRILNIGVGANLGFNLLYPQWGMWYLISLFWWKLFIKDLKRIRFILPLSILLGIISGFSREISVYLSIGRTVNLLFFFLLGYYCTKEKVEKIRRIPKVFGVIAVLFTVACSYVMIYILKWSKEPIYLKRYYVEGNEQQEIFIRLMVYVLATGMIFAFLNLSSTKKRCYTYIGTNSVSVYIIHLFLVKIIERFYSFTTMSNWFNLIFLSGLSILIAATMALPVFSQTYERCITWINHLIFKKSE